MIITKCAKRLMATVMTTALVLTGLVVAPKEVSAADGDPTVEVLGATLRLDGNKENCQSMRVGIKVTNASKAKACGIKLSIGTVENKKEAIVSTENGKTNIYDYDSNKDIVTYTAVITDIPKGNFSTDVNIQGTTKAINSETETPSTEVTKSVDSVVAALKEENPQIEMLSDGNLVKELFSLEDTQSGLNSIIDKDGSGGAFVRWKNASAGTGTADIAYSNDGYFTVTPDGETGRGLGYQFNGTSYGDVIYSAQIRTMGTITLTDYGNTCQNDEFVGNGDWMEVRYGFTSRGWLGNFFTAKDKSTPYDIKKFKIYQLLKSGDLKDDMKISKDIDMVFSAETAHSSTNKEWWYIDPTTNEYLNDGSVKVVIPKARGSAFYFKPDKTSIKIKDYSKIVITLSANEDNRNIRLGLSTDNNLLFDGKNAYDNQGKSTTGTANTDSVFEIDLTKIDTQDADIYGILIGEAWTKDVEVTIKSIKLIAK